MQNTELFDKVTFKKHGVFNQYRCISSIMPNQNHFKKVRAAVQFSALHGTICLTVQATAAAGTLEPFHSFPGALLSGGGGGGGDVSGGW